MFEKFLEQAIQIVAEHKAQYKGVYEMKGGLGGIIEKASGAKGWNAMRDQLETAGGLVGNYFLPGSSLVTDNVVSKGSKAQLNSPLGKAAQIGTGLAGAGVGSSVTGIPQSAGGAAEASLFSGIGNAISGAASSAGNALGITEAGAGATSAAPWINPDTGLLASADSSIPGVAAPWASSDAAVTPGASAAGSGLGSGLDEFGNPIAAVNPNNLTAGESSLLSKAGTAAAAPITSTELSSLAAPAAGTAGDAAAGGGMWNSIKSSLPAIAAAKALAGPLISGAGIATAAAEGNKVTPEETALKQQAGQEAAAGQQLQNYLPSGTLPPGAQAGIDQAANSAKAAIRSKYASMGMSGSSSEQQELSAVDSNAQAKGEALALQLLNTGITESSMSSQLYQSLLNNTLEQDKNLSSAIGNFASSVAGGSRTPNVTSNV